MSVKVNRRSANEKYAVVSAFALCIALALSLSACSKTQEGAPAREMKPLQEGQPPQKPGKSISTMAPVQAGANGTAPLPFNQPFLLGNPPVEYQFMAARGKDYVGLENAPSMQAPEGFSFFLLRYQVINRGEKAMTVPNYAAVHLVNQSNQQLADIDVEATNANIQSGAATGLPDQLTLNPGEPQIQTLVFQVPKTLQAENLAVIVQDPANPEQVFQAVKLAN